MTRKLMHPRARRGNSGLGLGVRHAGAETQNFSADDLARGAIERRAIEAVDWGMSAVNNDLMLQEMLTKTPPR